MIQAIVELLLHGDLRVKEFAGLLADIEQALTDKTITQQEYVSLMVDVERLRQVVALSNDLALDIKMNEAITIIIEAAKMAKVI